MTFTVVIPARYGSSRLPGKPLLDLAGKPMIQRVWEQAMRSSAAQVVIATDDERILAIADSFGARALMTSSEHLSGTDRLQEVVATLALASDAIVVNVQGDEPLIPPAVIDQVAVNLAECSGAAMATLCEPVESVEELRNPNVVKAVADRDGRALYFSRAAIPWPREAFARDDGELPGGGLWRRHIGIYAYRVSFLHQFVDWPPAPQEQLEQLEQLRALHNGATIHLADAIAPVPPGVDTEQDLENMRMLLARETSS